MAPVSVSQKQIGQAFFSPHLLVPFLSLIQGRSFIILKEVLYEIKIYDQEGSLQFPDEATRQHMHMYVEDSLYPKSGERERER